jgi:hypothetical protein
MGDKARTRAEELADNALEARRKSLIELSIAADAARDGHTVHADAQKKVDALLYKANKRAAAIIGEAQRAGEQVREAADEEMRERTGRWRKAYEHARDVGWTPKELRDVEQPPPPRAPAPRDAVKRKRTGTTAADNPGSQDITDDTHAENTATAGRPEDPCPLMRSA